MRSTVLTALFLISIVLLNQRLPFAASLIHSTIKASSRTKSYGTNFVINPNAYTFKVFSRALSTVNDDGSSRNDNNQQLTQQQQEETTLLLPHNNQQDTSELSFVSNPMQLYIEDTDAYGVMYNGNYIKAYERALHQVHTQVIPLSRGSSVTSSSYEDGESSIQARIQTEPTPRSLLLNYSNFYLTHCTSHKFKASPMLGSQYVIQGTLVQCADTVLDQQHEEEEIWNLEMVEDLQGHENCEGEILIPSPKIYNTATVTISAPKPKLHYEVDRLTPFHATKEEDIDRASPPSTPFLTKAFTVHRDEFDIHMPGAIPLKTTLNLFERLRSDALGGPDQLREMKEKDNILWVVTSVDDLKIDSRNIIRPGDEVVVRIYCNIKRKGMIVECEQEILAVDRNTGCGDGRRSGSGDEKDMVVLARGVITLCAIDTVRGRPTSKIPEKVKALFQ